MTDLGPYSALDWSFTVSASSPALTLELGRVLAPLATEGGEGAQEYRLESPSASTPGRLTIDGSLVSNARTERALLARLLWHINVSAVDATPDLVLLHAAAAERKGRAVVLCAPMEAGKTTLVTGLVSHGWNYLTDEITALRPADGRIRAFPKALSIDSGSWDVLSAVRPAMTAETEHLRGQQWQVPADEIRQGCSSATATPTTIVLPRYVADAETHIEGITPGQALIGVLQQTFGLDRQRERDMTALARVLEACACFTLTSGSLDEAVAAVDAVAGC